MARSNFVCRIPFLFLCFALILCNSLVYAERICSLPGFNECDYEGETGCCDVLQTMTSYPTGYYLCGGEEAMSEGILTKGVTEDGYGGACCPRWAFFFPRRRRS